MLMRKLPSFSALRAFEAVAATGSFTAAAVELGVTQAAISRQIKALEEVLGVPLIVRRPGGNDLTEAGRALYTPLCDSLNRIEEAVRSVSAWPARAMLTVSVAPFFSSVWLTPRVMGFIGANPDIDLRLHHSYAPPDYARERVDLGINWGNGQWPGVEAVKVMDGGLTVVAAPGRVDPALLRNGPGALMSERLFYEFARGDWTRWFEEAGVAGSEGCAATRIDDTHALRRIALNGDGFALLCHDLVAEDLECGRLVRPFPVTVDTGAHYFLNFPVRADLSGAAKRFRTWLLKERTGPAARA